MKNLIYNFHSILIICFFLTCGLAQANEHHIYSAEELQREVIADPTGTFILESDIVIPLHILPLTSNPVSCKIKGMGKKITFAMDRTRLQWMDTRDVEALGQDKQVEYCYKELMFPNWDSGLLTGCMFDTQRGTGKEIVWSNKKLWEIRDI